MLPHFDILLPLILFPNSITSPSPTTPSQLPFPYQSFPTTHFLPISLPITIPHPFSQMPPKQPLPRLHFPFPRIPLLPPIVPQIFFHSFLFLYALELTPNADSSSFPKVPHSLVRCDLHLGVLYIPFHNSLIALHPPRSFLLAFLTP